MTVAVSALYLLALTNTRVKILVIMHINVYKIDVSIFSVRKKKNLLKEFKVWILIPEQLLQPIFRRYFGGVLLLILGIF